MTTVRCLLIAVFLRVLPVTVSSEMFRNNNLQPDLALQSWYYVLNEREYFGKISLITGPANLRGPAELSRVVTNIVTNILSQHHNQY